MKLPNFFPKIFNPAADSGVSFASSLKSKISMASLDASSNIKKAARDFVALNIKEGHKSIEGKKYITLADMERMEGGDTVDLHIDGFSYHGSGISRSSQDIKSSDHRWTSGPVQWDDEKKRYEPPPATSSGSERTDSRQSLVIEEEKSSPADLNKTYAAKAADVVPVPFSRQNSSLKHNSIAARSHTSLVPPSRASTASFQREAKSAPVVQKVSARPTGTVPGPGLGQPNTKLLISLAVLGTVSTVGTVTAVAVLASKKGSVTLEPLPPEQKKEELVFLRNSPSPLGEIGAPAQGPRA